MSPRMRDESSEPTDDESWSALPAVPGPPGLSPELVGLVGDAEEYRQRARAQSTRCAYASD